MKGDTVTCIDGRIVEDRGETIRVFVPVEIRVQSGRKEIIPPDAKPDDSHPSPMVVAFARAYVWQKWLDEGEFANIEVLAKHLGIDSSLVRRILRLGAISPRVIEEALNGREPTSSLQALLNKEDSLVW